MYATSLGVSTLTDDVDVLATLDVVATVVTICCSVLNVPLETKLALANDSASDAFIVLSVNKNVFSPVTILVSAVFGIVKIPKKLPYAVVVMVVGIVIVAIVARAADTLPIITSFCWNVPVTLTMYRFLFTVELFNSCPTTIPVAPEV